MTTQEELEAKEIELLIEDEEIYDLETLITGGTDVKIPITISYPKEDGRKVKAAAMIRPVTATEWNNAVRKGMNQNMLSSPDVELLKKALYTKKGEAFPVELIEALPAGVVTALARMVADVSGVEFDKDAAENAIRKMAGF